MHTFHHQKVDILKVDIELAEFAAFSQLSHDGILNGEHFCQILIEVHGRRAKKWTQLLKLLESHGFLLFSHEPNPFSPYAHEMSFIHRDCLAEFNVPHLPVVQYFGN